MDIIGTVSCELSVLLCKTEINKSAVGNKGSVNSVVEIADWT